MKEFSAWLVGVLMGAVFAVWAIGDVTGGYVKQGYLSSDGQIYKVTKSEVR